MRLFYKLKKIFLYPPFLRYNVGMMNKRVKNLWIVVFLLSGCTSQGEKISSDPSISYPKVGEKAHILENIQLDQENLVFDDFTKGVNPEHWMIGSGAWGSGNGGVVSENVSYTEDGILLLRGNGSYYAKDGVKGLGTLKDGRNTGACLVSTFGARPGHYEVKMKPLPRQGACSAFWTYANRPVSGEENDNHEIDIELPGGKTSGTIAFKNVLNTNYIKESQSISQDVSLSEVTNGNTINLNDGNFHTFGFDWYTSPELIVYTIDGYVSAVSTSFIPTLEGKLWLGNWFPNNAGFVGNSLFETDYMEVDWVKYLPFQNQPYQSWNAEVTVSGADLNRYPSHSVVKPEVNLIANGDFEYFRRKGIRDNYGWTYSMLNTATVDDPTQVCYPSLQEGYGDSCGAVIKKGGYLSTVVDSVYEGQKFRLSFKGKASSDKSQLVIRYRDSHEASLGAEIVPLERGDWKTYTKEFIAKEGTYSLQLQMFTSSGDGEMALDDISLLRN